MILSKPFSLLISTAVTVALLGVSVSAGDEQKTLTISSGVMRIDPFAFQDDDGTWKGFLFDLVEILKAKAANDNVMLELNIDTENGVLSDVDTYNGALSTLAADCTDNCYDMIIGDYYHTAARSELVTFAPSYLSTYLTTFKTTSGGSSSMEEATAAGGSICLWEETATYDTLSPIVDDIVVCSSSADCFAKLKAGECDMYADDAVVGKIATKDDADIVATDEVLLDQLFWYACPMKSSVEPEVQQWMSKWFYEAVKDGDIATLTDQYIGSVGAPAYPTNMTISSGVMRIDPFAFQDDDGTWKGFLFDLVEILKAKAANDNVMLELNIDTENGVLSDVDTYNGALSALAVDCTDNCYDMIIGDYSHTAARSELVTFAPSYLTTYLTTFKLVDGEYNALEEATAAGGSICLWEGTVTYDTLSPMVDDIITCSSSADCFAKLKAGECDMFADDAVVGKLAIQGDTEVVATDEILLDELFFLACPMKSALDPTSQVLMTKWYHDAIADGDVAALEDNYIGGEGGGSPPGDTSSATLATAGTLTSMLFAVAAVAFV